MIHYEDFERERLDSIYDTIAPYSEMSMNERYFLNGIIRSVKPKKILEVGVLNGGGSAIILNAIRDIDGAMLYSADYSEVSWHYRDKPSGFLVEEQFPQLMDKWHIFRGGDVSRYLEEIGGDIDLLVLDTVHVHPWETLNFLCILPFMKQSESWSILHDVTTIYFSFGNRKSLACRYLFGHVVAEEKIYPASSRENVPANIGAFRISENTMKYAANLFESLLIPWGTEVSPEDYDCMKKIIEKYYTPEQYKFFCNVPAFQELLRENITGGKSFLKAIRDSLRDLVKIYHPGFYSVLRRIKHPFRVD